MSASGADIGADIGANIVTGEAVALDVRLARWPSRAVGALIDVLVQIGIFVVLLLLGGVALSRVGDGAVAATVIIVIITVPLLVYPITIERLWHGKSLGKAAMGLRVVRDDGGPIRFRHALVRALLAVFVDIWLTAGAGALLCSALNSRGKRVGDLLAGTVVVQERMPAGRPPMVGMPPELARWAASVDLSRLPDDLALSVRQFLGRQHELHPAALQRLGNELVAALGRYVAAPPPGTPGWAYLAAITAERRRREEARLWQPAAQPRLAPPSGSTPAPPPAAGAPPPASASPSESTNPFAPPS